MPRQLSLSVADFIQVSATPGTISDRGRVYVKLTDPDKLFYLSPGGTETELTQVGGGGTPAGSDGQVQYNNNGSFGGNDGLQFLDTSNSEKLIVRTNSNDTNSSKTPLLVEHQTEQTFVTSNFDVGMSFVARWNSGDNTQTMAQIRAESQGSAASDSDLIFKISSGGILTERVRIDNEGTLELKHGASDGPIIITEGNGSTNVPLRILSRDNSTTSKLTVAQLTHRTAQSFVSGGFGVQLDFRGEWNNGSNVRSMARFRSESQGSAASDSDMRLFVSQGGSLTETVTFVADGGVQLGNSSSAAVSAASAAALRVSSGGNLQLSNNGASYADVATVAGSDGQVQYNNGGSLGGASSLFYDDGTDRVGIGTLSPDYDLTVSGSGVNAASRRIADNTFGGPMNLEHARGSEGSESAIQSGDELGSLKFRGYNGSSFQVAAEVKAVATQNFSGAAEGANLEFYTTSDNATSRSLRMEIDQDGSIQFDNSSSAAASDSGTAALRVSGSGNLQVSNNAAAYVDIATTDDVASPGGSSGQVQFNSSGSFGADSNFHWDDTNKRLSLGFGSSPEARLHVDSTLGTPSVKIEGANDPESQLVIKGRFDENEGWGIFDNRDADADPDDGGLTFTKNPGGTGETKVLELGGLDGSSNVTTTFSNGTVPEQRRAGRIPDWRRRRGRNRERGNRRPEEQHRVYQSGLCI